MVEPEFDSNAHTQTVAHTRRFENISAEVVPRADALELGPDSVVGPYQIIQTIGIGGMASVFEAAHETRRVALKVLHSKLQRNSGMDTRMLQEASILDEIDHPGIARAFDCGLLGDGRPWIAMELVAGESLASKLARETTLPPAELCNLVAAVADVLANAHAIGIVHRDLKPDNILFAEAASGFPLRVIDWGIARLGSASRLTLDGVTCGTPNYMSPEQASGRDIAPPCDIYSLGVIAYEALCGSPPFEGRTLAEVVSLHLDGNAVPVSALCPTAPVVLCELIHLMLHAVPSARPTATEVRVVMQTIATEVVDDNAFESFVTASTPPSEAAPEEPIAEHATIRRPRWTPESSIVAVSSDTHDVVSGEILRAR